MSHRDQAGFLTSLQTLRGAGRPRSHVWRAMLIIVALACGESPTAPSARSPEVVTKVISRVNCVANTQAKNVSCSSIDAGPAAASFALNPSDLTPSDLIVGGQNSFIKLTSSNVNYTGDVFAFTTTVQNLIGQSLGTTDGTALDPAGVRVFFETLPTATSGSGTPDFINPVGGTSLVDGYATFTASNQPYYQYDQVLAPSQTSAGKTWRIHVPASVTTFEFAVYVSAEVRYPNGYVDVSPTAAILKAGATRTFTAVVRDVLGRSIDGQTVTWSSSNPAVATVDAGTGVATAVADGAATITATAGARTGLASLTVSTAAGSTSVISASPASLTVGSTSTITVQARNAAGSNMTVGGDAVTLSATAGTLSAVTDNNNGTYTATLNAASAATITVSGTINTQTIATSAVVTFTAGAPASITKSAGDAQTGTAGAPVAVAPSVTITDGSGNPVSGVSVTFAVATGGAGSGVTGTPATTNASGVATVGSWTLGNIAGSNTLTATAGALTTTFSATGVAGPPVNITRTPGPPQTATVNTTVPVAPSVTIADANGNPVSGVTVTFAVASGGGSVTGASQVTDASGTATVGSWKLGTAAGTNTLTATAGGLVATFTATGTAGAAANIAKTAGDAQTATAGSAVATAPSVTITDAGGNPVPGVSVTFAVASGGAGSGITGTPATTNASGVATAGTWTLGTTAGANTLSATAGALSTTFSATGVAGPPATATIQSTNPQTAAVGTVVSAAPSVLITDANNNPVPSVTVTFAVASGGGGVTGATPTTNASGIATVGSWTLGTVSGVANNTLTATSGAATTTFTATATAGSPSSIAITAGDAQTAAAGAAVATPPSVTVRDQYNNLVPNVTVTFSVTGGGGSFADATPTTNSSGVAVVDSWTLGAGGAGCSATAITSCSRNTLHAVATGGSSPAVDFKAYVPPTLPATATYQAVGNATLSVPAENGLLLSALSINGPNANGQGAAIVVTTLAPAGSQSGTAAIGSNGSFTYLSSPSYVSAGAATENFTYSVSDGLATTATTASLRVNVPQRVWYVQPGFSGASTGADTKPFKDFSGTAGTGVENVAAANDTILVLTGTGSAAGGILKATQFVYGQGASAPKTFATGSAATYRNGGAVITLLATGTSPQVAGLALGSSNTVRGFTLTSTLSGLGFGTLTVSEIISNSAVQAISLETGTLSGGFTSVTSTASANNNISMTSVGTSGSFGFGSGSLAGATNAAIYLNGGAGTVTYSGSVSNTTNLAADIFSFTGGGVTLSGSINSLASPGTGISVRNNTGGTFTFSGPIGISSGTATGVNMSGNSAAATVNITPSTAMQIATTSGTGFAASGAGTLNVTTGSGANTINSSGATAISLAGVTIGGSNLTFGSTTSGGGTNNVLIGTLGGSGSITLGGGALSGASGTSFAVSTGAQAISYSGTVTKTSAGQLVTVASRTGGGVTLSGNLSCTSSCGSASGAIGVTSNSGGTVTFSGGTKTISPASGFAGVTLATNTGSTIAFTNGGLAITTAGAGVGFSASAGGTVSVTGGGNSISSPGATAVNLNAVTIPSDGVTFGSVTSGGGTNNVALVSTAGTGSIALGSGALTGASGAAFSISGTNANPVSYSGSITKSTSGGLISVTGHTANTIDFSGTLSCTSCGTGLSVTSNSGGTIEFSGASKTFSTGTSTAVSLSSNTGATINFPGGGLALTTTSAGGFSAAGGGTVNASGSNNTIVSTTGTALSVQSTNIGSTGLTFRSVSANGGSNGIYLASTGTAGGLTVTGDGSTNGSGGTIQNTTGADGATGGNGIYLSSTAKVKLSWMAVTTHQNNGLFGTGVSTLDVDHVRFTGNNGTSNSGTYEESPVHLVDVSGGVTIKNSVLNGGAWDGFLLRNTSGAVLAVDSLVLAFDTVTTMQGSTSDVRNTALQALFSAGMGNVRMRNNYLTYWWGNAVQVGVTNTATVTATVLNNKALQSSGALAAAGGIEVNGGNLSFNISGNQLTGANGTAISADKNQGNTFFNGTIDGNTIGTSGVANSGSFAGVGIFVQHHGVNATTVKISNNIIRQIQGTSGITALIGDNGGAGGAGALNVTITGNAISEPGTDPPVMGIGVTAGTTTGDTDQVCADIGGAGALANSITGGYNTRIRPNQRFLSTLRLPGYTGARNDNAAVNTYLTARNPGTTNLTSNSVATYPAAGGILNTSPAGSACAQPTL